jgi:hypothetical protein
MPNYQDDLIDSAKDTLMHIAATSGVAAKDLRASQSLEVDLGLGDAEFAVLAAYQCALGDRLRTDGLKTRIDTHALRDWVVWQVLQSTLERATGRSFDAAIVRALIVQAQSALRSARPPPD